MDFAFYLLLAKAVIKELWRFRYVALVIGFVIGIAGAAQGYLWQEKYVSRATLYADQTNIISPLLQAATTEVQDQLQIVRDTMLSQRALELVIESEGFLSGGESAAQRSVMASGLRSAVQVRSLSRGDSYIEVSYESTSPERAYNVVKRLVDLFIEESSESKRNESRQAYLFIDKQVATYKEQLRSAENNLKDFNASNLDGTEAQAQGKIESLRQEIENVELDFEQVMEKTQSLEQQVAQEDRYLSEKARSDVYNERVVQAIEQLDDLRLVYTDNHPDVIALQEHIAALREAKISDSDIAVNSVNSDIENPVYDELRSSLAAAKVESRSIERRLNSLNERLTQGRDRLKRIVSRNAELTELTRDYNVTKGLYEDLLNRKEQARLSMTLDIEGQGLNYKVQEPANFPRVPSGLQYLHFIFLGVAAGLALPLGLVVAYVMLDPRIRFARQLQDSFSVPLLADVPHLSSGLSARLNRTDAKIYFFWVAIFAALYCGIVVALILNR